MTTEPRELPEFDVWWKSKKIDPEFPDMMDDRTFAKAAWEAALASQPRVDAGAVAPVKVFLDGDWTYNETGQRFAAADLDEAALAEYLRAGWSPLPSGNAALVAAVQQWVKAFLASEHGVTAEEKAAFDATVSALTAGATNEPR